MRLHPAESRIRKLASETPAKLVLFDILADRNGIVLIDRPLSARRAALEAFIKSINAKDIELSPATFDEKEADAWLNGARDGKTDGVIAKRRDDAYLSGETCNGKGQAHAQRRLLWSAVSAISPTDVRSPH